MTDAISHTFPKAEKLKSRKQIDLLFREGKSFFAAPVKCFYRLTSWEVERLGSPEVGKSESREEEIRGTRYEIRNEGEIRSTKYEVRNKGVGLGVGVKVGFSVSKKQFKKAVDRNRVKRLMREAYRLHKHKLKAQVEAKNMGLEIFFVFTDKTMPDYKLVEEKIKYCLRRLGKIMEDNG